MGCPGLFTAQSGVVSSARIGVGALTVVVAATVEVALFTTGHDVDGMIS